MNLSNIGQMNFVKFSETNASTKLYYISVNTEGYVNDNSYLLLFSGWTAIWELISQHRLEVSPILS